MIEITDIIVMNGERKHIKLTVNIMKSELEAYRKELQNNYSAPVFFIYREI